VGVLQTPLRIGSTVVRNRLYRAPVLEGAGGDTPPRCQYSNLCVPAQMLGMKGVCYNPAVTRRKAVA